MELNKFDFSFCKTINYYAENSQETSITMELTKRVPCYENATFVAHFPDQKIWIQGRSTKRKKNAEIKKMLSNIPFIVQDNASMYSNTRKKFTMNSGFCTVSWTEE